VSKDLPAGAEESLMAWKLDSVAVQHNPFLGTTGGELWPAAKRCAAYIAGRLASTYSHVQAEASEAQLAHVRLARAACPAAARAFCMASSSLPTTAMPSRMS
jgi:hypothetical protein